MQEVQCERGCENRTCFKDDGRLGDARAHVVRLLVKHERFVEQQPRNARRLHLNLEGIARWRVS